MTSELPLPTLDPRTPYWDYKAPRGEMYLAERRVPGEQDDLFEVFIVDPYRGFTYCSANALVTTLDVDEHNDVGLSRTDWVKCLHGRHKGLNVLRTFDVSDIPDDSVEWSNRQARMVELAEWAVENGYDYYTHNGIMP